MEKITPLPGYCLIEPIEDEEKSAGGVYLPENSKDKPSKGKVIALSPVIPFEARDALLLTDTTWTKEYKKLKVGSIVIHRKWVNETVNYEGKEYLFIRYQDLMGILE